MLNFAQYIAQGTKIIENLKNTKKKIILYGAAKNTQVLVNLLKQENVNIYCFVVSDGMCSQAIFNDLPVYEISKNPIKQDDCKIIVSPSSKHHKTIGDILIKKGYKDIDYFADDYELSLAAHCYDRLVKKYSASSVANLTKFGNAVIPNITDVERRNIWAYVYEVGELILPSQFNDLSMIVEGPYEFSGVSLQKNDVVFDCGANLGLFSCVAAAKGCTVFSFEPTRELIKNLKNLQKFYNGRLTPCEYALSDKVGNVKFGIGKGSDGSNSFIMDDAVNGNYVTVKTTTIDQFVKENGIKKVDFIKADIEGAERLMLAGAKDTLARFSPKISICTYHLPDDPQVLEKMIKDANPNYIVEHNWQKLYAYVPNDKISSNI